MLNYLGLPTHCPTEFIQPSDSSSHKSIHAYQTHFSKGTSQIFQAIVQESLNRNRLKNICESLQARRTIYTTSKLADWPKLILDQPLQRRKLKTTFKEETLNEDKPYDAWTNIGEGFAKLYAQLKPDDPASEVDKVVKYILDQNIPVRHLNSLCKSLNSFESKSERGALINKCPNIKFGRFSRGPNSEEEKIKQNWEELVKVAGILNPDKCMEDFIFLDLVPKNSRLPRRHVLGCHLAQGLNNIRLGLDTFHKASRSIYFRDLVPYTAEDDALILSEVEKCGDDPKTFSNLKKMLRKEGVREHFLILSLGKKLTGIWTLNEYEMFFKGLFDNSIPDSATIVGFLESRERKDIFKIARFLPHRSPKNVENKWVRIKSVLLSYHNNALHNDHKTEFLKYIVEKKISCSQDIDWKDVFVRFPNQNSADLAICFRNFRINRDYKGKPFYICAEDKLESCRRVLKRAKLNREKVVMVYNKVRGVQES